MDPCAAKAIIKGSKVPRSPSDPDISAHGAVRRVVKLLRLRRRKSFAHEGAISCAFNSCYGEYVVLTWCSVITIQS